MFSLFTKACLLYKTSKIVYARSIFTIYDMGIHGVTRGYRGLQEVTGGYKGLQRVTGGYKGLQRVTGGTKGYKGLQGVTGGRRCYVGLQRIIQTYFYLEHSQILFLRLFRIKTKIEKISYF